jgi:hypothetical protein
MAKAKKTRAKKYDPKLKIHGSFEDVIKLSVRDADKDAKKETVKNSAKKK